MPDTGEVEATEFALALHNSFDAPITTSQGEHSISCSIGLATSSDSKSLDEVLTEADILMYEQKKRQQRERSTGTIARKTVERALFEDRVEVWHQPIVTFKRPRNSELSGCEAMVRIKSRDGGIILPEDFMAETSTSSQCIKLDHRILTKALHSLTRWVTSGIVKDDFLLSVKMTEQTLNDPGFSGVLAELLDTSNVSPRQLMLELPGETSVLVERQMQLRALGVRMSVNRMGSEHSGPNGAD